MDFKKAAILSNYISKDYAEDIFKLLMSHHNISASEAASRLEMHIRTVQEFLEVMAINDIINKEEVYERKRPYFRYSIKKKKIEIIIDLEEAFPKSKKTNTDFKIREMKNSGAKFSVARNGQYFSTVSLWIGNGREGKQRTISLTVYQGTFLYHLPFPDAEPLTVEEIMKKSGIGKIHITEINHIIDDLFKLKIIEKLS